MHKLIVSSGTVAFMPPHFWAACQRSAAETRSAERRDQQFHHISAEALGVVGLLANCSFCCCDKSQQVAECFTSEGVTAVILLGITLLPPCLMYHLIHRLRWQQLLFPPEQAFPTVGDRPQAALLSFFPCQEIWPWAHRWRSRSSVFLTWCVLTGC